MAWTTPRTWVVGEIVTAALLNTHLRDNLNAIGQHVKIRKGTKEDVTSNATVQGDDELTFAALANETWFVAINLGVNTGAGGFRFTLGGPTGASGGFQATNVNNTDDGSNAIETEISTGAVSILNRHFIISGVVVVGATAGNILLRWAQAVSDAAASSVLANSTLIALRA